ncbi:MAG: hypothetical protein HY236_04625, partial [Acidobacteria bacterium]|nr:hypothetical protein [Acidobacteriota bacterium]
MEQSRPTLRHDLVWALLLGGWAGLAALSPRRTGALWLSLPLVLIPLAWWMVSGASRWVLAFLAAAFLLPPLPLPWGDAGPHPALLPAALGLWAGVARLPAWRIRRNFLSASLVVFLLALLLSVPAAVLYSSPAVALGSLARVGLFAVSVYLFFYLADGPGRELAPERLVRLLFWAGTVSAAFACLDFYFQFPALARFAEQFVWLPGGVFRRAQGVFYEASTLGSFCVFLLVMMASIAVLQLGGRLRLSPALLLPAAIVCFVALILSFSRAAMISLVVALLALLWLERKRLQLTVKLAHWGAAAL